MDTLEKEVNINISKLDEQENIRVENSVPSEITNPSLADDDIRLTEGVPLGLMESEVKMLTAEGKINVSTERVGKSYLGIIGENLFTYFNLVWAIVTTLLLLCNSYSNLTFLLVIIPNLLISIIQEIKAKRTVEKLSLTTEPKATVIRDGILEDIRGEEIVLGDVMLLETGRQILADAVVVSGLAEANESLLTGESDAIKKQVGDNLLAGSFIVGGKVYAKVINVGRDNYIHKIEKAAKNFTAPSSNLFHDLNKLIKVIGMFLVPMSLILFLSNWFSYKDIPTAIVKTCGSVIGMIPAGIYLLVTLTLTLSVIKLGKKRTLVQDMYSIEMLASADVLCLDKTGTITDGTMTVNAVIPLGGYELCEIERIMSHIEGTEDSVNNTSKALVDRFGKDVSVKIIKKIPFSSTRKYSAVSIEGLGAFSIGAPHFVPCPVSEELDGQINRYAEDGQRVLLLVSHTDLDAPGVPIALLAIADRIRPGAKETIDNFQSQGVTIKVISGDHAKTVSTIAEKVGISNADRYISCENLTDEELISAAEKYTVFGRVTPEQKILLVKTLKVNGHTVAMTGDGVNDTLALKESNCAIAMADGSEMARKVSQIVLMDSDFSTLPDVVREGRRCINNVRNSSVLFLMKTIFTISLSIISVLTLSGYPFDPKQFLILEMFIIGLASLLLAIEPNNKRIEGSYLDTVIVRSFPNAMALLLPILLLTIIEKVTSTYITIDARNSIAMALVTLVGYINLVALCSPINKWRGTVCLIIAALIGVIIPVSIFFLNDMLEFRPIGQNIELFILMLAASMLFAIVMQILRGKIEKFIEKRIIANREHERQKKEQQERENSSEI